MFWRLAVKFFQLRWNQPLDQVYYSPLARQYCLQGPTDVMGIINNFHLVGEDTIRLGSIWGSRVVPNNSDQYYQLSTENWRGIICTFPQFYHSSLLWTLNYLESQISLLEETICLCLDSPYMYVLETISRVGAIVELTLLAPHLRNTFSAAWHLR